MRNEQHCDYSDFAILYRTNAQSRSLEDALRKRGVPYKIYGGLSFYQRKEIKDVISYFRLSVNPSDEEAFKRVINYPARGIGDTTVSKIAEAALNFGVSYYAVLSDPIQYGLKINAGTAKKLASFFELIESFRNAQNEYSADDFAQLVIKQTGIIADLTSEKSVENQSRLENIEELINGVKIFVEERREEGSNEFSLTDFLQNVSLATDQDDEKDEDFDKVTLMTVHASKGLEFPNVFIVGLEDNLFPSSMSKDSPAGIEEERRLMYVAITRAEKNCIITYAGSRYRNGETQHSIPSPFIRDIDPQFLILPTGANLGQRVNYAADDFASSNGFDSQPAENYQERNS